MGENSVTMKQNEEKRNLQMAKLKVVMTNPEMHIEDDIPLALEDQARIPLNAEELSKDALQHHRLDVSLHGRPWRQPQEALRGIDGRYYPHGIKGEVNSAFYTPASSKVVKAGDPEVSRGKAYGSGLRRGFLTRKVCFRWQSSGECSYGNKCRFSHEIPEDDRLSQKYDELFEASRNAFVPEDFHRDEIEDMSSDERDKSWVN